MTRTFGTGVGLSIGVGVVLAVGLATRVAASAPVAAAPSTKSTPSRAPAPFVRALSAKVVPEPQRCGEPARVKVVITNGTGQAQTGIVHFTDGSPQLRSKTFSVGPITGNTQEIVVTGAPLVCGGPLKQVVRVHKTGETSAFYTQSLRPTTFVMEQGFAMPPFGETRHWLRRIAVTGSCSAASGATVMATVTAPTSAPGPTEARVTFTIGGQPLERTGQVAPSQNLQLSAPVPLDCAATGLPSVGFALATGMGATGTLAPSQITFEP